MKLMFSFLLVMICCTIVNAQTVRVKYTEGTYFNGEILADTPTELTLLVEGEDTVRINQKYVEKRYTYPENIWTFKKGKFHFTEGWYVYLDMAAGVGSGGNVQFDALLGRRLTPNWGVGFNTAWHQYHPSFSWQVTDDFFTPSLYGRRYLTKKRTRLYLDMNVGYGLALEGQDWGVSERTRSNGFFAASGLGIHFASRNKTRYLIAIGQNFQYSKGRFIENFFINEQPRTVEYDIWYVRPVIRLGMEFF